MTLSRRTVVKNDQPVEKGHGLVPARKGSFSLSGTVRVVGAGGGLTPDSTPWVFHPEPVHRKAPVFLPGP